jgi:hypothetical protein
MTFFMLLIGLYRALTVTGLQNSVSKPLQHPDPGFQHYLFVINQEYGSAAVFSSRGLLIGLYRFFVDGRQVIPKCCSIILMKSGGSKTFMACSNEASLPWGCGSRQADLSARGVGHGGLFAIVW